MIYTKVKQKYQVTIPQSVRQLVGIREGDTLEARVEDGRIILIPKQVVERKSAEKKNVDISRFIGSMKGTYGKNTAEMDAFLRKERDSWE